MPQTINCLRRLFVYFFVIRCIVLSQSVKVTPKNQIDDGWRKANQTQNKTRANTIKERANPNTTYVRWIPEKNEISQIHFPLLRRIENDAHKRIKNYGEKQKIVLRPFFKQSNMSVENGLFRLKPKSGFLRRRKRAFSTQLFSTENSDWRILSRNSTFSTGSSRPKT